MDTIVCYFSVVNHIKHGDIIYFNFIGISAENYSDSTFERIEHMGTFFYYTFCIVEGARAYYSAFQAMLLCLLHHVHLTSDIMDREWSFVIFCLHDSSNFSEIFSFFKIALSKHLEKDDIGRVDELRPLDEGVMLLIDVSSRQNRWVDIILYIIR